MASGSILGNTERGRQVMIEDGGEKMNSLSTIRKTEQKSWHLSLACKDK